MNRISPWIIAGAAIVALALAGSAAGEAKKSVNEKILDLLLEDGRISKERYEILTKEAQEEVRAAELPQVVAGDKSNWNVYWNDGTRVESPDGKVKIKFGGRVQFDMAASDVDGALQRRFRTAEGTGTNFRRARIFFEGLFGEHGIFKAQYDFGGQDADFKDVYAGLRNIPYLGTVRAGHIYEPQSIGMTTSSKYMMFLERGLPVLAFTAERNAGIGFHNQFFDKRITLHGGFFQEVGDDGEEFDSQGDYNVGARVTALPIYEDEGNKVVHTGFWYSRKFGRNERVVYNPDAESNTVGSLLFFGPDVNMDRRPDGIPTDGQHLAGAELALVLGPLSAQGEIIGAFVDGDHTSDRSFFGSYVAASYFLTGERRNYDQKLGAFGRTKPSESFSLDKSQYGGLELAGRWSFLSLNDGSVRGGILNNYTIGLNWYLYSNLRLMVNYVLANRNGVGQAHIAQSRVALDF